MWLNPKPSWSVLLLLKDPILFDLTKVTEESEKHWESSSKGVYMPFQHFEKQGLLSILLHVAPRDSPHFTSMHQQTLGH